MHGLSYGIRILPVYLLTFIRIIRTNIVHCELLTVNPDHSLDTTLCHGAGDSDDFFKSWTTGFSQDESNFVSVGAQDSAGSRNRKNTKDRAKSKKEPAAINQTVHCCDSDRIDRKNACRQARQVSR